MKQDTSVDFLHAQLMRIKIHYESDFSEENIYKLNNDIECIDSRLKNKIEINNNNFKLIVKKHWIKLILQAIDDLLYTIKNRKLRGSEFAEILSYLEDAQKDFKYSGTNLDIGTLQDTYEDILVKKRAQVKEKIKNEKYNLIIFVIGLFIGFLFGIAASYIPILLPIV